MRNLEWEDSLYQHQHQMIKRLDTYRKQPSSKELTSDDKMVIEHSFQLLVASMLDLAKYVLKHHYKTKVYERHEVLKALLEHNDVTFEQGEQMRILIEIRENILFDYLDENFNILRQAMELRRYSLVEVLTKEWTTRLKNIDAQLKLNAG
ncbi:MAG: hypothetical protein ACPGUE_04610 [Marinomonas sp.]|jgi:uncharacterized protein YutE (UPF0331/DUF86 family)|uniref:hypothetical protein n=1 Tax=unclassified Marinomonas TaxID=196814 RepID=UPI0005F9A920|nr:MULTISPECIES: hypothetical protein [unclassified Marinomonas]KJZ11055.1 hypothetical protein TW85_18610 [Marinomonas sp. S3726]KZM40734.1 hypothetical protein OA91_18825 [Marinomonas sp. SBI8L]KZM46081.1 hypothetical protein OA92_02670 [Marinomonas sp. SBI22]